MAIWDGSEDVIGTALNRMGFLPTVPGRDPMAPSPLSFEAYGAGYGVTPALTGFQEQRVPGPLSGFQRQRVPGPLTGLTPEPALAGTGVGDGSNQDWFEEQMRKYARTTAPPQPGIGAGIGGSTPGAGGPGQASGEFAVLNRYDAAFQRAAAKFGLPANVLKAVAMIERGWEGTSPSGAVGIMQVMPQYWGDAGYNIYSDDGNIMAGALAYRTFFDQYADEARARGMDPYVAAARAYLAGNPWSTSSDYYGTTTDVYGKRFQQYLGQLGGGSTGGGSSWGGPGGMTSNDVVRKAMEFVGLPYVWGGIPGKGDPPGAWDCSGMTYWMDQNWGTGQLPMGSHYQYQYAQRTGKLFTDLSQLQPGDLVFIDTGWQGGAGAELNRAGHVAMYVGNGKMIHAANASAGTIISDLSAYQGPYGTPLGAMHMSWSGGGGGGGSAWDAGGQEVASPPSNLTFTQRWINELFGIYG